MKYLVLSFLLAFGLLPNLHATTFDGIQEIPVDDPEINRLTEVAFTKLNDEKPGGPHIYLLETVKASRQIVAGILTRLTLRISDGEVKYTCEVEIWEQPWINKTDVSFPNCGDASSKTKRGAILEDEESKDVLLQLFDNFLIKHNKRYSDEKEYKKRFHIFRANMKKIKFLRKTEQGTGQYGLTWFADLSAKEFKQYLGLKKPEHVDPLPSAEIPNIKLPDNFDWRHYNVVTPVKDQKMCGSCWAFSVTGNIEGQWALKKGELLSLSEQELVDCDSLDNGCGGGYMTNAYKSIMELGGLETEGDYPYEAKNEQCHYDRTEARVKISSAVNITSDEHKMAQWLFKNGPMSVALNANAMQFYFGGVSHPLKFFCNPENLDHGVLIVGFGVHQSAILKKTLPYWLIKNSWGKRWGERGYYRLYRGSGACGVNNMVSSAIVN